MNREEQVGLVLVRDPGSFFQGNKGVILSRVDHLGGQTLLEQRAQAFGNIQDDFLFGKTIGSACAFIVPAMAGIEDDAPEFQAQDARQGLFAIRVPFRRKRL